MPVPASPRASRAWRWTRSKSPAATASSVDSVWAIAWARSILLSRVDTSARTVCMTLRSYWARPLRY